MKLLILFYILLFSTSLQAQTINLKESELRRFELAEDFTTKEPIIILSKDGEQLKAGNYKMILDRMLSRGQGALCFTLNASGKINGKLNWKDEAGKIIYKADVKDNVVTAYEETPKYGDRNKGFYKNDTCYIKLLYSDGSPKAEWRYYKGVNTYSKIPDGEYSWEVDDKLKQTVTTYSRATNKMEVRYIYGNLPKDVKIIKEANDKYIGYYKQTEYTNGKIKTVYADGKYKIEEPGSDKVYSYAKNGKLIEVIEDIAPKVVAVKEPSYTPPFIKKQDSVEVKKKGE